MEVKTTFFIKVGFFYEFLWVVKTGFNWAELFLPTMSAAAVIIPQSQLHTELPYSNFHAIYRAVTLFHRVPLLGYKKITSAHPKEKNLVLNVIQEAENNFKPNNLTSNSLFRHNLNALIGIFIHSY